MRIQLTPDERFWSKVNKTETCWLWTAGRNGAGYGFFSVGGRAGRHWLAHRWAYTTLVGPIPAGLELDHLCRTPLCVRPDHLEPVTHTVNVQRGFASPPRINEAKTHCPRGHEYNVANTYYMKRRPGRQCRVCRQIFKKQGRTRKRVQDSPMPLVSE